MCICSDCSVLETSSFILPSFEVHSVREFSFFLMFFFSDCHLKDGQACDQQSRERNNSNRWKCVWSWVHFSYLPVNSNSVALVLVTLLCCCDGLSDKNSVRKGSFGWGHSPVMLQEPEAAKLYPHTNEAESDKHLQSSLFLLFIQCMAWGWVFPLWSTYLEITTILRPNLDGPSQAQAKKLVSWMILEPFKVTIRISHDRPQYSAWWVIGFHSLLQPLRAVQTVFR